LGCDAVTAVAHATCGMYTFLSRVSWAPCSARAKAHLGGGPRFGLRHHAALDEVPDIGRALEGHLRGRNPPPSHRHDARHNLQQHDAKAAERMSQGVWARLGTPHRTIDGYPTKTQKNLEYQVSLRCSLHARVGEHTCRCQPIARAGPAPAPQALRRQTCTHEQARLYRARGSAVGRKNNTCPQAGNCRWLCMMPLLSCHSQGTGVSMLALGDREWRLSAKGELLTSRPTCHPAQHSRPPSEPVPRPQSVDAVSRC
jgi:hypothetical protein